MRMEKEDAGRGWCKVCEEWVDAVWADMGIGPYEFWGDKGVHHEWVEVCPWDGEEVEDITEDQML